MSNIDEIKARIDIVDLASETVKLRRSGKNYSGFCPFHDNKRTPAFAVFPETGTWRCFGQCNEGGDIFKFVMKKEGWDFGEALRNLAERAGVQLRPPTPQEQEHAEENERLRELLEAAVTFFRHQLKNTPAGNQALEYIRGRGLNDETIESWGLGYAPKSWDLTWKYFQSKGYSQSELIASGMVSQRDSGGVYDRFRHRAMFPIRDERGRMTGFGARILDPNDVPKFLNSPQTDLFDKGTLLYGLDMARRSIRSQDQVVIVEGYLDVIATHQHGFENVVSPMGTALTEAQFRLLKRRTRRFILALDPDAAGDQATLRGLQTARQTMDREQEVVFDARGLLRHEARMQADIRVTTLPDGMDPDDVVNRDPQEWAQILADAKPVVVHVMETLASGRDLEDPKVKSEVASQVLPLIADVPSAIERDTYRQRLARLLKVDERALASTTPVRARRRRRVTSSPPAEEKLTTLRGASVTSLRKQEAHCIGILLRKPNLIYSLDRALQNTGLTRLGVEDFLDADHQVLVRLILESLEQDFSRPLNVLISSLPLSLMELADKLLLDSGNLDSNDEKMLEDMFLTVVRLRINDLHKRVEHLRFLMEESQTDGSLIDKDYLQTMKQYTTAKHLLDKALGQSKFRSIIIN